MKLLAFPEIGLNCTLKADKVLTLVIENQFMFSSVISDLIKQINGEAGHIVLSENYTPISMKNNAEIISQLIPFTLNKKELITKIYASLVKKSVDEKMYQETQTLISEIEKYIINILNDYNIDLSISNPADVLGIFKLFDLKFDEGEMSLPDKLIVYMDAVSEYIGKKTFFIVNLRSYLVDEQAALFFKNILLKDISLVCIENTEYSRLGYENRVIIDKDMCVI